MTDKSKIIDKIRKLLALSKSPNEHEAELALTKAMDLMSQHDLEITQLEESDIGDREVPNEEFALPDWKGWVAVIVSDAFECSVYTSTFYDDKRRAYGKKLKIVGTEVDTALATYVYQYVVAAIETASRAFQHRKMQEGSREKPSTVYMSHVNGMYAVIKPKIIAYANARRKKAETDVGVTGMTGKDIILIKKNAVSRYMEALNLRKGQSRSFRTLSEAEAAGRQKGSEVDIHDAISGQSERKFIGNPYSAQRRMDKYMKAPNKYYYLYK